LTKIFLTHNSHSGKSDTIAHAAPPSADRQGVLQTERGAPTSYPSMAAALWRQREAMQLLADALAGRGDVRAALHAFRLGEVFRAVEVEDLAHALGLDPDASLADLAAASAEPWRTVLTDHWIALQKLYTEVTGRAAAADVRIWQQSLDDFLR
jgi:hypothetical protein